MKLQEEIKIIIADDHPIFLNGLKQIIAEDEKIKVIGEASDGLQTLDLINKLEPDIAVIDVDMPKKNGLEVLKEVSESSKKTKIIFLTMYKEEDMFDEAMERGIMGYVLKESALNDIVECINCVNNNRHYISPLVSDHLINRHRKTSVLRSKIPLLESLTKTELKILKMIAENKTSKEISAELFISYRTVENHRTNISSKLSLRGSYSLIKFAVENKSIL